MDSAGHSRSLVGSRWRGASGDVATVEGVLPNGVVYGKWNSGILWSEFSDTLPRLYVEVDGGPAGEAAR